MIVDKTTLKTYFETGDFPNEEQFVDLIDSLESVRNNLEYTYADLKDLIESNSLDLKQNYILNDYVHKYYIENTNSSGKIRKRTTGSIISGYGTFNTLVEDLLMGMEVTITKLPENYSGDLQIGDKDTVSEVFANYYFKFSSGKIHLVEGLEIEYFIRRYNNIEENIVINDANGKPILKPNGIINTEVHDGTPYMDMTDIENQAPTPEKILLTPLSSNSFETVALSLTYKGDIVHFDFDDNKVENDNKIVIGERKGFIKRRINKDLNIDVNCNWREQKFRRWLLSDSSIDQFINVNEDATDVNVMTAFDGKYLFTSEQRTKANANYFYIIPAPEYLLNNLNTNGKVKEFEALAKTNLRAKDFSVFQLDNNKEPVKVAKCIIEFLANSVFQMNPDSFNVNLNIENLKFINNSTFTCYANLIGATGTTIEKVITLDALHFDNFTANFLKNINFLGYSSGFVSSSSFENIIFGTNKDGDIIGPGPHESVSWIILNMLNCKFLNTSYGSFTTVIKMLNIVSINSCLYFYSNKFGLYQDSIIVNSIFNNATLRLLHNNINVTISGLIIPKKETPEGWIYSIPKVLNSINIKRISSTGELYYEEEASEADNFTKKIFVWNQETNNWELTNFKNDIDLENYVTLNGTQTISGEKIFNNNLGVGEQSKLKFYAPDTSGAPGAGFDLNLESEVFGIENQGLFIDSDLKTGGNLNLSNNNITNVKDITAESFKKSNGLSTQFLKADGSVDQNTYDNYQSFNLKTDGVQRTTIRSEGDLDFTSPDGLLSIGYGAGGVVQLSLNELSYNDLIDKPTNTGGEPNVQSDWNATSGDALILNKPTIPTNNNELTNGAGYITSPDGGNAATLDGIDSSQFLRNDQNGTLNGELNITNGLEVNSNSQSGLKIYQGTGAESTSFWFAPKNDANNGWDTGKRFGFYETDRRWCVEGDYIVIGDVVANNFQLSSDKNLKENVAPLTNKDIINVDWKSFNMKKDETKSKRYGVIAQELEKTNPELVKTDSKGEKSVLYIDLLIAKIAELESRIKELEAK
ncbi:tail fiber domain-containing protein [Polaribacter batillariae]|uniref:Tail fiber domain-containing protein n=1 Tax=Polaribacter batillariae TaxID=2808900 RepID=A0ABX7SYR8_9FLAO|nr:tail fiber domain-containing protein [Polaribacter batillariae]QTD39027.1 tail fiber domain-containing protein [Polaribacter batillariae]